MNTFRILQDKKYVEHVNNIHGLIKEVADRLKAGFREDFIREEYKPKFDNAKKELQSYAVELRQQVEQSLKKVEKDYSEKNYEDPSREVIRRQDVTARLSLYDDEELTQYLNNIDSQTLQLFDYDAISKELEKRPRLNKELTRKMAELKDGTLYKFRTDEEYQALTNDLSVIITSGIDRGQVMLVGEDNEIVLKDFDKELESVYKFARDHDLDRGRTSYR